MMADLRQSPMRPSSMGDPTRTTSLEQAMRVRNTDGPPIIRHLMRCPHKIIDDLQLENSNLMKRVKELERNPRLPEEEEQSTTKGNTVDTRSNRIKHFGRTYAYTV